MKIRLQTSIKCTIASAFALVAAVAMTDTASAGNDHNYNGSYCKAFYGSSAGNLSHQQSGIVNLTSSNQLITCPVLVDEARSMKGTDAIWLHWQAGAAFPNDTIRCTFWSRNGNGSPRRATAGSRTGSGWFAIANVDNDDFWGSYTLTCTLPRGATLNTVRVEERL